MHKVGKYLLSFSAFFHHHQIKEDLPVHLFQELITHTPPKTGATLICRIIYTKA